MKIFLIWRGRAGGYKVRDEEWLKCLMLAKTMEWVSGNEVLIFDWTFWKAARIVRNWHGQSRATGAPSSKDR
jgi:hypothetical protein